MCGKERTYGRDFRKCGSDRNYGNLRAERGLVGCRKAGRQRRIYHARIVAWIAMIINSKYFTKCNVRFPVARRSEVERNLPLITKILRRPDKADEIAAGYELL